MSCCHEKKPDIGNCVEPSPSENCAESSTRWPSAQYFRSIIQRNYQVSPRFDPVDESGDLALNDRTKIRSEEHTSELQSHLNLVCRLLLEKKKIKSDIHHSS